MNRDEKHARKPSLRENFSEKRMYYEKLADKYHILQYMLALRKTARKYMYCCLEET